jgi:hypothetical protein
VRHPIRRLVPLCTALLWVLCDPDQALAWGPGTHVALGEIVLGALHLLPPAVQALLERFPLHFLYGSVAADISLAKKYVPEGRHCHNWHVGEEILHSAPDDPLRAVGYGYLAHLAADTIAHNVYVPRRLLITSTSQALGHTYWEHRMDMHMGEDYMGKARRLVTDYDHTDADDLMNGVLSRTIFSFETNRKIFRGVLKFQDDQRWRLMFDKMLQRSRFDLPDPLVDRYRAWSVEYIVGYLREGHRSAAWALDPVGDLNLRLAKKVRRRVLAGDKEGDPRLLEEAAEEFFPFPTTEFSYWPEVAGPAEVRGLLPGGPSTPPVPPPEGGLESEPGRAG